MSLLGFFTMVSIAVHLMNFRSEQCLLVKIVHHLIPGSTKHLTKTLSCKQYYDGEMVTSDLEFPRLHDLSSQHLNITPSEGLTSNNLWVYVEDLSSAHFQSEV